MKVNNPTDQKIEVVINGTSYSIEPKSSLGGVPTEHAERWQKMTHNFLIVSPDDEKVVEPVLEPEKEVSPFLGEEGPKEEILVEKPKKAVKKVK